MAAAARSRARVHTGIQLPSTCPRLFVHSLPDGYRSTSDVIATIGRGIGQPVKSPDEGFRIYDGQQYQLGEHFYKRALSYRCRTLDPADADLFFVPAFSHVSTGWTNTKKRMVADNMSTASRDDALFTRLRSVHSRSGESVLDARGGADHVLLVTREGLLQDGSPYWELDYADSRLGAATRLAISEFRSVWHAEWPSSSVDRAAADQYQSVPYNAVVHADTHMRLVPWQHLPSRRRDNPLVAYTAGSRSRGEAALLRAALTRSCIDGRPWCDTRAPEAEGAGVGEQDFSGISALYYAATFCLQPIGDTISRKGVVDALLLGCIPVLFHRGQQQQWGWFWGSWVTDATVLFNMTAVIDGTVDVVHQLRGIAPARVTAMRETISRHAHAFQWSSTDSLLVAAALRSNAHDYGSAESSAGVKREHIATRVAGLRAVAAALEAEGDAFDVTMRAAWELSLRKATQQHGRSVQGLARLFERIPHAGMGVCDTPAHDRRADCNRDDMGMWSLALNKNPARWAHSLAPGGASHLVTSRDCVRACEDCRRCRYVSYSLAQRTCAWFAHCPAPGELKTDVGSLLHRSFTAGWAGAGWDERGAPQTWFWHAAKTFKTIPVPKQNYGGALKKAVQRHSPHIFMAAPFSGKKTIQGHCGETWFSGHCERFGGQGAWRAKDLGISTIEQCAAYCRKHCSHCNYVSFHLGSNDCSWYQACPQLQRGRGYQTLVVRAVASKLPHNLSTCEHNNVVLPRYDGYNENRRASRPYSISSNSFPMLADASLSSDERAPWCGSVAQLLTAVAFGHRVPVNDSQPGEDFRSVFAPFACSVPHHTGRQLRRLMALFRSVLLVGDSISRQFFQALRLIESDNYAAGAVQLPALPPHAGSPCVCDGQFSEAMQCRALVKKRGDASLRFHLAAPTVMDDHPELPLLRRLRHVPCDGRNRKSMVFWLQGGAHYKSSANRTLYNFLLPALGEIQRTAMRCNASAHTFVSGMDSQSRRLDSRYPAQARERAVEFNRYIAARLPTDVHFVEFMNLTADARMPIRNSNPRLAEISHSPMNLLI